MNIQYCSDWTSEILRAICVAVAALRLLAIDVSAQMFKSSLHYAVERIRLLEVDWTDGICHPCFTMCRDQMVDCAQI
ncbi:hypothetical protein SH528x_003646 [Novipirellula sp. SH528]|uniref:hypothetical protein n=1 Tax=Novipirellula sp. SH528 TaxID=3454466 RepID=UPI003FA029DF